MQPARLRLAALAAVVVACAAGVAALYAVTVASGRGQRQDDRLSDRTSAAAAGLPTEVLGWVSVASLAAVLAVACGVALARRRPALALAAVAVVGGANVTTQVLKQLLERPDAGLSTLNSFPSGHTTAAASAVAALLLVVPGLLRLVVAGAGAVLTAWVGLATVVVDWHRVSDAVAAVLVVAAWTAGAQLLVPPPRGTADAAHPPRQSALTGR